MPDAQWGRPAGCYIGCTGPCHQGRLPCPHRPADVESMRDMGIDLQPNKPGYCRDAVPAMDARDPHPHPVHDPLPLTLRTLGIALLIAGLAIVASFFAPWGFALPL